MRGLAEGSQIVIFESDGPHGGHAATETDHRQLGQPTSEVPETNGSNVSGTNQLVLESIDTVGVTGSIPVSPTNGGPVFRGLQAFPGQSWAALGPLERWLCWLRTVRLWPRCGPAARPTSTTVPSARNLVAVSLQLTLRIRDVLRVLDGEQPLRQ
jgi:hypothetical protein